MATLARPSGSGVRLATPPMAIAGLAAACAALIQSLLVPLDCDVSWLITVNEKMLDGQRLYVDVIDPNPPASVWLYTPAVALAHGLRIRPEAIVAACFIAGALVSVMATLRITARLRNPPNAPLLAAVLAFTALLLPLGTFAQREHAALLLALPALAAMAVIAEGGFLPLTLKIACGIAAGLVIAIKPHFALAIVAPAAFAGWKVRAVRPLMVSASAAAMVAGVYVLAVVLLTPAYVRLIPMLATIYLPLRDDWLSLLRGPVVAVPLAIYALAFVSRPRRVPPLAAMFLLASGGFTAAALIEAKGYLNHALPGMALGFCGLAQLASEADVEPGRRKLVWIAGSALALLELYAMASIRPIPGLAAAVERAAPPAPGIVTLGPDLLTGHPVTRNVGGRWLSSRPALFIAAGAHRQLPRASGEERRRLQHWFDDDVDAFTADVRRNRPDVVLVDSRPAVAWLRNDPRVARAMLGYRAAARAGDVEVWIRR